MKGAAIAESRLALKLTQDQLAQVLGCSRSTIQRVEENRIDSPPKRELAYFEALIAAAKKERPLDLRRILRLKGQIHALLALLRAAS